MPFPDPRSKPVMSVPEAGTWLGCGRSKAYVMARRWQRTGGREGIPCIELGSRLVVPTAQLQALLGLVDHETKEVA